MPVLKVKHVTIARPWAPVAPLPVIPTQYTLVKGILILLPASHQQNTAMSWERSCWVEISRATQFTPKLRVQLSKEKGPELAHVLCPVIFSCSTASVCPGGGVERTAGVQACSKDNANIPRVWGKLCWSWNFSNQVAQPCQESAEEYGTKLPDEISLHCTKYDRNL